MKDSDAATSARERDSVPRTLPQTCRRIRTMIFASLRKSKFFEKNSVDSIRFRFRCPATFHPIDRNRAAKWISRKSCRHVRKSFPPTSPIVAVVVGFKINTARGLPVDAQDAKKPR